jgi:hypothetical protein
VFNISESCMHIAKLSLELNDKDCAREYFKRFKRLIKIYPQQESEDRINHLRLYTRSESFLGMVEYTNF